MVQLLSQARQALVVRSTFSTRLEENCQRVAQLSCRSCTNNRVKGESFHIQSPFNILLNTPTVDAYNSSLNKHSSPFCSFLLHSSASLILCSGPSITNYTRGATIGLYYAKLSSCNNELYDNKSSGTNVQNNNPIIVNSTSLYALHSQDQRGYISFV